MRNLVLTFILSVIIKIGFAADSNAIAYKIGEFFGMLIPIGVVVLIIWLIVRAVNKKKRNKE